MSILKKIITVVLSASVLIVSTTAAMAAGTSTAAAATPTSPTDTLIAAATGAASNTTDINKMAAALNKLNILQGTNGNYLLNNQTSRSDAIALIIRMLGKENYVIQNADQLRNTKFVDVIASKWYAPYVGYGTLNNILSGKTVSTFAPTENTTEKQFLKMTLGALGYIEGTDFDWSNIYQKAYSIGLVTDQAYIAKTLDNKNYLRSEAVKVIYHALNTPRKGTQKKLAYTLVDEGSFTMSAISSSGIISDDQATVIDLITPTAMDSIEVNLNENIQSVNVSDISIYDSKIMGSALAVKSAAFKDDKIQVITAGQIPGRSYSVKINSVTDISGNISGVLTGSFNGYAQRQITSDFFRISKVEQASSNVINVYFTHPVNSNSEIPAYYEITKNGATYIAGSTRNMTVKKLQSSDNAVSILLKNLQLTKDDVYGVKISGKLTSGYGVKLGDGLGESMDFVTTASQNGQLDVSSVQAWTINSVRILFNYEVDPYWAGQRLNYKVYDINKNVYDVTSAFVSDSGEYDGKEVILTLAVPFDKTKQYELKMELIPDIYMQSKIENKSVIFSGAYPENSTLALNQAASDYNNCVVLTFNRSLDKAMATNVSSYVIKGVSDGSFSVIPAKAYYAEQYGLYMVKLYLPAGKTLSSSQRYTAYVTGMKDALGSINQSILEADFTGGSNTNVKPQITDAVTVSKDTIKLYFNVEVAFDVNNISTTNYSLENMENGETMKMAPVGVTYVNANTLILKFDELDQTKSYQIRFNTITDYSGIYPRMASDGGNTSAVRWGK